MNEVNDKLTALENALIKQEQSKEDYSNSQKSSQ